MRLIICIIPPKLLFVNNYMLKNRKNARKDIALVLPGAFLISLSIG